MIKYLQQISFVLLYFSGQFILAQECNANAGLDIIICDGDGSNSNYTYLDGSQSYVNSGAISYK
jgi:hypothetical protein